MRTTTSIRVAAPLAVVAVATAACGGSSSGGNNATGNGNGNGSSKTYTIACQGPLTGDNAALGINICNGVKLAIDQANAKGSLPFKLAYKPADDQGSPDGARPASASLAQDSSVIAVVGPAFSGATQASEGNFAQAGILSITPSATLPSLTDPKNGFTTFYRAVPTDVAQGTADGKYLKAKVGAKKVFIVDDAEVYGQGLANALEKTLKSEGVATVHDSVPAGTKQYEPEAAKAKQSGADVVFYAGYYADGGPFAKALHNAGFTGTFMSDDGTKDPNFVKLAGTAASNNALLSCGCKDLPASSSFPQDYTKAFNQAPGTYSGEAFDVTNAIIQAMQGIGANVTRKALVDAAANIDYQGITHPIAFNSNHELKTSILYLYKVENGTIKELGPINKLLAS